jgi:hypothetical protein
MASERTGYLIFSHYLVPTNPLIPYAPFLMDVPLSNPVFGA